MLFCLEFPFSNATNMIIKDSCYSIIFTWYEGLKTVSYCIYIIYVIEFIDIIFFKW